jgi:hypothetical protein
MVNNSTNINKANNHLASKFTEHKKKRDKDTKGQRAKVIIRISKRNRQQNGQIVQKDKQRSTKHTHKTKDRETRWKSRTCLGTHTHMLLGYIG